MKEEKTKKDAYERALSAYSEAMKEFHKGRLDKAQELLMAFLEKYDSEKELVDRARLYLQMAKDKGKKETLVLKSTDDYFAAAVYKMNSGACEEAIKLLEKTLETGEEEGRIFYLMADAYALMGKMDEALDSLKKAFQKDKIYRILAQNEVDFEPLWEDKKFKLITRLT